jgi:hypothetical protein
MSSERMLPLLSIASMIADLSAGAGSGIIGLASATITSAIAARNVPAATWRRIRPARAAAATRRATSG